MQGWAWWISAQGSRLILNFYQEKEKQEQDKDWSFMHIISMIPQSLKPFLLKLTVKSDTFDDLCWTEIMKSFLQMSVEPLARLIAKFSAKNKRENSVNL
jgi:hypothetical protein